MKTEQVKLAIGDAVVPALHEPHITIYSGKSIYSNQAGAKEEFVEGATTTDAKQRLKDIREQLDNGYLDNLVADCIKNPGHALTLNARHIAALTELASFNSESGRAILGLTFMQLTIKAVCPAQSIRLHKGGPANGVFSWQQGISMRSIDSNYITPILRKYGLVSINKFGIMMTRTLAENYPYTPLYKAAIMGAKGAWLAIIEWVESGELAPADALRLLVSILLNRTNAFTQQADELLDLVKSYVGNQPRFATIQGLVTTFVEQSGYSARIFEIAVHAFMQALDEAKLLPGYLKPMSQMRSANKKHGNIGDIELTLSPGRMDIFEAWDAKYGKPYLRDELDELGDKLTDRPDIKRVGFITNTEPDRRGEIEAVLEDLAATFAVDVRIVSFAEWIQLQIETYDADLETIGGLWLTAIAESIGQKRRNIAPIDEPTNAWVATLIGLLKA